MFEKRKELLKFAQKFINICEREQIWYSLDRQTLKGSQKHGGFVPWEQRFEVMVTVDSYKKLKRIHPQNVVDSFWDKKYKQLAPVFVANNKDWVSPQPFIRMRILVPTTISQLKRFFSLRLAFNNFYNRRPRNLKQAINDLMTPHWFQGYYLLENRRYFLKQNWIQALSLKTKIVNFSGLKVNIINEYDQVLKYWYGDNYLDKSSIPQIWYNYTSPFVREKGAK